MDIKFRIPAGVKLIALPILSILVLCLPYQFALGLIVVQFILSLCLRVSFKTQLKIISPVLFYALMLFCFKIIALIFSAISGTSDTSSFWLEFSWENERSSIIMLARIFAMLQSASLVLGTTTSLEIRSSIAKIDRRGIFTDALALFINFIPMVFRIWAEGKRAWLARGGRVGIKMCAVLLINLFSVGMKKAWNTSRALQSRSE